MKIKNNNPLNRLYSYWVELGGKPTYTKTIRDPRFGDEPDTRSDYKDNLCHFMRVVLVWVWFRWFFCRRWWGRMFLSPFIVSLMGMGVGLLLIMVASDPFVRWIIITAALGIGGALLFVWLTQETLWGKTQRRKADDRAIARHMKWQKRLEPWVDTSVLLKDWLYAKKTRICPTIEVER